MKSIFQHFWKAFIDINKFLEGENPTLNKPCLIIGTIQGQFQTS